MIYNKEYNLILEELSDLEIFKNYDISTLNENDAFKILYKALLLSHRAIQILAIENSPDIELISEIININAKTIIKLKNA